uniref:Non-homologous end-joining factor 1 n=1 Tax=Lepisosteus oculatus TaxID=7918 RepID=W5MY49_LEPOC|nr:PREDICTED: non-homologous end-joining factor 1 [Lepisosteus oculatus]XP_015214966.1 PREDICTED: non-homologous end-joining factor 1 [Lepisosteus oculatus]
MEVSGHSLEDLSYQPWVPVEIASTCFLAKVHFGETSYQLLLSDLDLVWHEQLSTEAIRQRAQELNRRLTAPVSSVFRHLRKVAQPRLEGAEHGASEAVFSHERVQDNLHVRVKSELAGVPFYWEFRCTPVPVTVVCEQLVRPLLAVSRLLHCQVQELTALLQRKDAEIQDYRESGVSLSRGRLETEVFVEQHYVEHFLSERLSEVSTMQNCYGFNQDIQKLCTAVAACGAGHKRNRSDSHSQNSPTNSGETLHHDEKCSAAENAQDKAEKVASSGVTDGFQQEQTVVLGSVSGTEKSAGSQRTSVKPKKKKAKGLFG